MKISIIIPTYNEKGILEDCIESLGNQTFIDFEIIVVDDGSTDGTIEVLQNLSKILKEFSFYRQNHLGAGAARNFGAKKAKGDILVFVDADMTFDENFLDNLTKPIRSGQEKGTFSKEEIVSNWKNVWSRCWNINEGWEGGRRHPKNYPDHQPVFRAILRREFERVGGYTPGGYDDDWSLGKKLGYDAVSAPGAIFYHKNPSSLGEIFSHAKWVGKRKYKFGLFGEVVGLARVLLPFSILIGLFRSVIYKEPRFIIFKIVYDFGILIGIVRFIISGAGAK